MISLGPPEAQHGTPHVSATSPLHKFWQPTTCKRALIAIAGAILIRVPRRLEKLYYGITLSSTCKWTSVQVTEAERFQVSDRSTTEMEGFVRRT
jgi:hypothetical protein